MAKTSPFVPVALVVEDDVMQREMVAMLLQESEMGVIQCENAEAALDVLEKMGALLSMMFTDVNLSPATLTAWNSRTLPISITRTSTSL